MGILRSSFTFSVVLMKTETFSSLLVNKRVIKTISRTATIKVMYFFNVLKIECRTSAETKSY